MTSEKSIAEQVLEEKANQLLRTLKVRIIANLPISKEVMQSRDNEIRDFVNEKFDEYEKEVVYYFKEVQKLTEQKCKQDLKKILDEFEKECSQIFVKHYGSGYLLCKHEKRVTNDIIIELKELKKRLNL